MANEEVFLSYRREDTELIQSRRCLVQSAGFPHLAPTTSAPVCPFRSSAISSPVLRE